MKTNMKFLPIELCKKLQGIMNLKSHFVYNKEQIINPEIVEKHGDLTDDMFEDNDYEFQREVAKAVDKCLWGVNDEVDVYKETDPTENPL